ncbi:MAG: TetR family transcriptional regulator [Streptosporangiales bacterium]|nr:TetR family transcriptional regulator [Streptosporangiales bacterium]
MTSTPRPTRGSRTRALIVDVAERLFAERGIAAVSNRQIGEAAGQGNNSAVGYHFGTKADLVRAIVRRHTEAMEHRRAELIAELDDSAELRDWVGCLVRPVTDHLASLPAPTWFGRFLAQADAEPTLRQVIIDEVAGTPAMRRVVEGLARLRPHLPEQVRLERGAMARILIVHVTAERESALHDGAATPRATWDDTARGLTAAICGIWQVPADAADTTDADADDAPDADAPRTAPTRREGA